MKRKPCLYGHRRPHRGLTLVKYPHLFFSLYKVVTRLVSTHSALLIIFNRLLPSLSAIRLFLPRLLLKPTHIRVCIHSIKWTIFLQDRLLVLYHHLLFRLLLHKLHPPTLEKLLCQNHPLTIRHQNFLLYTQLHWFLSNSLPFSCAFFKFYSALIN